MNNDDLDSPNSLKDYYSTEAINTGENNYNGGTDDENSSNNGFNVTIEEAVFKYVRGIELDYIDNIPDDNYNINIINHNNTVGSSDGIYDFQTTNQDSLSSESNLRNDKTCEFLYVNLRNKRNLDEIDKLNSLKRIRSQNDMGSEIIEEDSRQLEKESNCIIKGFSIENKGSNLINGTSYEPILNKDMLLPTFDVENEFYQPRSSLLMGKHYQNILPKTKESEDDNCFNSDQTKISKSKEIRKLVEKCILQVSQLKNSNGIRKNIILEKERIMKSFIQRYQEIYELSYYDLRYIILSEYANEEDMLILESTSNNSIKNKIDVKIIDHFWSSLYEIFPGHLHLSLNKRVCGLIKNCCKKSKWTNEEDRLLHEMCTVKGLLGKWNRIGYLLNRTPEDCRNRWRDYGVCQGNQKKNQWTIKEEEQLFKIIVDLLKKSIGIEQKNQNMHLNIDTLIHNEQLFKCAINWNQVSKYMGYTRSRIQCQYKWKKLLKRRMLKRINDRISNNDIRQLISIIENRWTKMDEIDWHHLSNELNSKWYPKELEHFFNIKLRTILNHKQLTIKEVCKEILRKLDS